MFYAFFFFMQKTIKKKDDLYMVGSSLEEKFTKGLDKDEHKKLNELLNKMFNSMKEKN